ncbi:hypothetical protein BKA80DRAFT_123480 [Phyllosticta citrichinensis]
MIAVFDWPRQTAECESSSATCTSCAVARSLCGAIAWAASRKALHGTLTCGGASRASVDKVAHSRSSPHDGMGSTHATSPPLAMQTNTAYLQHNGESLDGRLDTCNRGKKGHVFQRARAGFASEPEALSLNAGRRELVPGRQRGFLWSRRLSVCDECCGGR